METGACELSLTQRHGKTCADLLQNDDLVRSGQSVVAADCIYAIIGAVALQRGGDLAARVVRERILAVILGGA